MLPVPEQVAALWPVKGWGSGVMQQHMHPLGQASTQWDVYRHVPVALAGQPQHLATGTAAVPADNPSQQAVQAHAVGQSS